MCDCSDLIGRPYHLGADGTATEIDCIHLVYTVLERLGIQTPEFNPAWYDSDLKTIIRAIKDWGNRVAQPEYDGDVVMLAHDHWAFGVTWQSGILYINRDLQKVAWCPLSTLPKCRCYRLKKT
jgi:hypothetical protein